jgi:hypothetical protein
MRRRSPGDEEEDAHSLGPSGTTIGSLLLFVEMQGSLERGVDVGVVIPFFCDICFTQRKRPLRSFSAEFFFVV